MGVVLVMLVDELLEHEGLSYVDIKMFPIGIVKVGDEIYAYFMPNSPYFLVPLILANLDDISFLRDD